MIAKSLSTICLVATAIALLGCNSFSGIFANKKSEGYFTVQDFQPSAVDPAENQTEDGAVSEAPSYSVNAMVGQVDGKPIYADEVLNPMSSFLEERGKRLPEPEFRAQTAPRIDERLKQIVITELILSDAVRDLDERQVAGVKHMVAERRAELIRTKGQGSELLAEQAIRNETKNIYGLDDYVEQYRKGLIINSYRQKHIIPEIVIPRRMIEQYYVRHPQEFNTPAQRVIRWIRVELKDADKIQAMLDEGKPFAEVASTDLNRNNPENGGLFGATGITEGDKVFPPILQGLNEALPSLGEGEYSKPVEVNDFVCWVYVEKRLEARSVSLFEAQDEIRQKLTEQAFNERMKQYRLDLLESGRFDPIPEMRGALVEVATGRYLKTK